MRYFNLIVIAWLSIGVAHADWFEATTPRVRVVASGSETRARQIAEKLERIDATLRVLRGGGEEDFGPAGRLTVYAVPDSWISRFAGSNIAGFYVARAGGSVAFVPQRGSGGGPFALQSDAVLFHEYAHHYIARNFPGAYPGWLSEGIAEFHGTAQFDRDGSATVGHVPQYRAYGLINGPQLPIAQLLEPDGKRMSPADIDNFYGRGWLLTHLLTFSDTRKGQLSAYLQGLREGKDSLTAAKAAFGDLKKLNSELNTYVRRRLLAFRLAASALTIAPVAVRRLSVAEEAMMRVHVESESGVTLDEARTLLPAARRAAARFSGDAFAQGALAEAEYDAGYHAEARDAALRTIAADPKSRQGLIYHGMALAALAEAAGDRSDATYRAVLAPWMRANRLDPDDPRPMALIYQLAKDFDRLDPSIVKGIKYAQLLAPEDHGLGIAAATEYLREGEAARARPLIASLAYNPHAGNRQRFADILAAIDAGDAVKAHAMLTAAEGVEREAVAGGE